MFCPSCQTVLRAGADLCPACGDTMHPILATDVVEVVEGGVSAPADTNTSPVLLRRSDQTLVPQETPRAVSFLARLPELSLLAWQQPAVRAAVKTGASAVALSLAMRVARQLLLAPRRRAALPDTMLPVLGEWLPSGEAPRRSRRGVHVSETIIYVRRTRRL